MSPQKFLRNTKTTQRKIKNENEITTIQERDHEQAGREETGNEGTHGCHRPRRQGSGCFCARRESRWDAHPWPRRARLPLECECARNLPERGEQSGGARYFSAR